MPRVGDTLEEICVELFDLAYIHTPRLKAIRQMLDVLRFHFPNHPVLPETEEMKERRLAELKVENDMFAARLKTRLEIMNIKGI